MFSLSLTHDVLPLLCINVSLAFLFKAIDGLLPARLIKLDWVIVYLPKQVSVIKSNKVFCILNILRQRFPGGFFIIIIIIMERDLSPENFEVKTQSTLVEGDEQPDRSNSQTYMEYCNAFFRFVKTQQLTTCPMPTAFISFYQSVQVLLNFPSFFLGGGWVVKSGILDLSFECLFLLNALKNFQLMFI